MKKEERDLLRGRTLPDKGRFVDELCDQLDTLEAKLDAARAMLRRIERSARPRHGASGKRICPICRFDWSDSFAHKPNCALAVAIGSEPKLEYADEDHTLLLRAIISDEVAIGRNVPDGEAVSLYIKRSGLLEKFSVDSFGFPILTPEIRAALEKLA